MIHQLDPYIPITTPAGPAIAIAMIELGPNDDYRWICIQDDGGAILRWRPEFVRIKKNYLIERNFISPFYDPKDVALKKEEEDVCDFCGEYSYDCVCGAAQRQKKQQEFEKQLIKIITEHCGLEKPI